MSEFGESFARPIIREMRLRGISTNTRIRVVHQKKSGRWLLSGEEGGGAARGMNTKGNQLGEMGHYVGYLGVAGVPLTSIPIHSLLPNRTFRKIFSSDVLRVEAFRYEGSCNLTVCRYHLHSDAPGLPPKLYQTLLFRAFNGVLNAGSAVPTFFDNTGEAEDIPSHLLPLVQAAIKGVTSIPNRRAHCIPIPFLHLPSFDISGAELVVPSADDEDTVASAGTPVVTTPSKRQNIASSKTKSIVAVSSSTEDALPLAELVLPLPTHEVGPMVSRRP